MGPINGETPQVDWPVVEIGGRALVVRWTFYAQWLLSKRKVNVRELQRITREMDACAVDLMVECFTAAVAENFTSIGQAAPASDFWAQAISQAPNATGVWKAVNQALWTAILKAQPAAATPSPQAAAQGTANQTPN